MCNKKFSLSRARLESRTPRLLLSGHRKAITLSDRLSCALIISARKRQTSWQNLHLLHYYNGRVHLLNYRHTDHWAIWDFLDRGRAGLIAEALMSCFYCVSRGQNNIYFTGFSRCCRRERVEYIFYLGTILRRLSRDINSNRNVTAFPCKYKQLVHSSRFKTKHSTGRFYCV